MIRRFFRALWNAIKTLWVVALFITLLLILLVWLAGPFVAIAGHAVLESVTARLVATVVLIFCWGLFVALSTSRRKKKELADPEKAEKAKVESLSRTRFREELDHIKDKFKKAIGIVTHSNFYGPRSRSRYSLPWYLVIGPKHSGKTSFMLNSGLQFPLNEQADRHLYSLRETERCETLFANQAVFIDTPGEYTDAMPDTASNRLWMALLKRIFHVRPAKPVNGIIVCISMRELMDTDAARREHVARTVRERLSEVLKKLHAHVPVYLVFTKCDAVPGFAQFFTHLSRAEREQIFGCPIEGEGLENTNVRVEIKEMMQTLNAQIISKIHQERDITARGEMFRFPQELAILGQRIEDFVYEAFGPSRYHKPVMFRGFFFTSTLSVHDILRATAKDGELAFQSGFQPSLGDYAKGFFVLRLLQDLIIPEARLAGADKEHRWKLRFKRYGLQLASAGLFLFLVFFLGISFVNNYSRVDDVDARHMEYVELRKETPVPPDSRAVLPELVPLAQATGIFSPEEDPMVAYHLGLYQGEVFDRATNSAYLAVLNNRLMPHIRREAADRVDASLANVADLKAALRSYIMLCQPKHLKEEQLMPWLGKLWSDRYLGDAASQSSLNGHMQYLVANGIVPVEPDAALLERARQALLKIPLAELAYQQMKEEAEMSGRPPFTFRAQLGENMSPFDGDTYPIPYLYTRNGYEEYCIKRCPVIIANLTSDNWIFGSSPLTLSAIDMNKIYKDVRAMYFRDYTTLWAEGVQNLKVRVPVNLAEASRQADLLTGGISPITLVLREIRANTTLVLAQEEPDQLEDAVMDQVERKAAQKAGGALGSQVGRAVAKKARSSAEEVKAQALAEAQKDAMSVKQHFLALDSLLDADGNAGPSLKAAHDALASSGGYFGKLVGDNANQRVFSALLEVADGKNDTLRMALASAERLPSPVRGWYEVVPEEGFKRMLVLAADNINEVYRGKVLGIYSRDLSPYYPFNSRSEADVNLDNFATFFRSGGVLDNFYSTYVQPFTNPNGTLRSIMGSTLPLSSPALMQLARANRVQGAFFSSGRDLGISFMIEPYALDESLKQVDLAGEGKTVSYWHGLVKGESYSWPQTGGVSSSASLVMTDLTGYPSRRDTAGEWALFRILQAGTIKRQEGNRCLMEVQLNGKWAQFLIQFRNRLNPFDPAVCSFILPHSLR